MVSMRANRAGLEATDGGAIDAGLAGEHALSPSLPHADGQQARGGRQCGAWHSVLLERTGLRQLCGGFAALRGLQNSHGRIVGY